jgi:hypothetical protein
MAVVGAVRIRTAFLVSLTIAGCGGQTAHSGTEGLGGGSATGDGSSSSVATGGASEVRSAGGGTTRTSGAGSSKGKAGATNSGGTAGADSGTGGADSGTGGADSGTGGATKDPSCPSDWSGLTNGGYPNGCTVNGVICWYPEGQAECSPLGSALKWWTKGQDANCSEFPPETGTKCDFPGSVCQYITGPPNGSPDFVTIYCCDGNDSAWDIRSGGGCPNGNVCGTIHAADYDQTCSKDSDCVGVVEGDLCTPNMCTNCTNAAVNAGAEAKYTADFASKDSTPLGCPCGSGPNIVCKSGLCSAGD